MTNGNHLSNLKSDACIGVCVCTVFWSLLWVWARSSLHTKCYFLVYCGAHFKKDSNKIELIAGIY